MNNEYPSAKEWIEALRSGKYTQTQNRLRRDEGFCCLGVYCDLIDTSGWAVAEDITKYLWRGHDVGPSIDVDNAICSMPVKNWYNYIPKKVSLLFDNPDAIQFSSALAEMNDKGYPFEYIADFIERVTTDE